MKIKGKIRGLVLTTLKEYIIAKKGKEGVKKVEKKIKEINHSFSFEGISSVRWYPANIIHLVMLLVLEVFGWSEEKNFEIGYEVPINSIIAKLMLRAFVSLPVAFKTTPRFWRNYTDLGEMNWVKTDIQKREAVLRLTDYPKVHLAIYEYFRGYLKKIMETMIKSKNLRVEITKSIYKGDEFTEFTFAW